MNIVKQAGFFMLFMGTVAAFTSSWWVSVPLLFVGIWVFLIGGLSG